MIVFRSIWKPTEVKKKTMQTSRIVLSKVISTVPVVCNAQVRMAKRRPPITGAGMQKRSKKHTFRLMKVPSNTIAADNAKV